MMYIDGHPTSIPDSVGLPIILVLLFLYLLPSLYNFWKLFTKAGKPGWAVFIPVYGPIVAGQIGQKPLWVALMFGIVSVFQFSSNTDAAYIVAAIQVAVLLVFGLVLLAGMAKQYKAGKGFWWAIVLFPIAAYRLVDSVKYSPRKLRSPK